MRNFRFLLGTCIVGIVALTTSAFAYFNFSSNSSTDTSANAKSSDYVNNIKFDNTNIDDGDRTYNLYFFASPYYATGSDITNNTLSAITSAKDNESPLDIAKSSTNPYNNSSDEYALMGTYLESEEDLKYSNITWSSGKGNYVSVPEDSININEDGTFSSFSSFYTKRDFTGCVTVLDNYSKYGQLGIDDDNINDTNSNSAYTYFKLQVTGGIKVDILNKIVAENVFKNYKGFGPEFMGWTYDKVACFNRTTYSYGSSRLRYLTNSTNSNVMYSIDKEGNGYGGSPAQQIGNFGNNDYIRLLSADDSLYEINSLAIDGSDATDNNIYLYPVFGDVTSITSTTSTNHPILKMLTNPDIDENSTTYYKYNQIGEHDYSYEGERYSTFLVYNPDADTSKCEPNYTLKNFHVDQNKDSDGNYGNLYQLEALVTVDENGTYASQFYKIFDNTSLSTLFKDKDSYFQSYVDSYNGYFDIDIIFLETNSYSFSKFPNDELYINTPSTFTQTITDGDNTIDITFVIGIRRDNTLRATGVKNSSNIFLYDGESSNTWFYKSSKTYQENDSYWHFFTSNPLTLKLNQNISVLIQDAIELTNDSSTTYFPWNSFQYMTGSPLNEFNNYIKNTDNLNNRSSFKSAKIGANIYAYKTDSYTSSYYNGTTITTPTQKTISNFPIIQCNKAGTYEILLSVKYSNGFPKQFGVAFREITTSCNLLVLNSKPEASSNGYVFSEIYSTYSENQGIIAESIFDKNEIISSSTKFDDGIKLSTSLNGTYKNKILYDLATGEDVTQLIKDGKFYLSRNMILYYGD